MKKIYLLLPLLLIGLSGCVSKMEETANRQGTEKVTDKVKQALVLTPGISNVTTGKTADGKTAYLFTYDQAVDHSNPAAGTFSQRGSLIYSGADKPVVLKTQGYYIEDKVEYLSQGDLATFLEANVVEIEHRYFGASRPEGYENIEFNYLYTEQAAADIHTIVKLLKDALFKENSWIATGINKGGTTTTLQAYYSQKNGWKDIDLYVAFCAPFLTALDDPSVGDYLWDMMPELLKRYPAAITGNKTLRDQCLKDFHIYNPGEYGIILKEFGQSEKELTCGVVWAFFEYLFDKFAHVPYTLWSSMVPDPDTAPASQVSGFIFTGSKALIEAINDAAESTKSGFTDLEIASLNRRRDTFVPSYVQACRELGLYSYNYSGVDGVYVSADKAKSVGRLLENAGLFQKYNSQWDGGALMSSVRSWVATQTEANMIFVYGSNDPWTAGGVDPSVASNPRVTYIVNEGGCHSSAFLDPLFYSESATAAIKAALTAFLK